MVVAVGLGASAEPTRTPSLASLKTYRLFDRDYIRLEEWAGMGGFTVEGPNKEEEVTVRGNTNVLRLKVNSVIASIDGVKVWLSIPFASKQGSLFISRIDLSTLIHPILYPGAARKMARIQKICIDAGHGGKDPGNQADGIQEKNLTLLMAFELKRHLGEAGYQVAMTRQSDRYIEPADRPFIANKNGTDLFLSIHCNSSGSANRSPKGIEVYCLTPPGAASTNARGEGAETGAFVGNRMNQRNVLLGYCLQSTLTQSLGVEDRGLHRARFAVLKDAAVPAVLIETGFMTNEEDLQKLNSAAWRKLFCQAVVRSLQQFQPMPPATKPVPKPPAKKSKPVSASRPN